MRDLRWLFALLCIVYTCNLFVVGAQNMPLDNDSSLYNESLHNELLQQFTIADGCYMPRNLHLGELYNEFFLYFSTDSTGMEPHLRLYIQYCADDPLHYYEIIFIIDSNEYPFTPVKPTLTKLKRHYYLETSDTELFEENKKLIEALANNHGIVIKLKGAGGMGHVIPLTDEQCVSFTQVIKYYHIVGGKL